MTEITKQELAEIISQKNGLSIEACTDIIDEVITQITELSEGKSRYHSIEEIIVDYLDLAIPYVLYFIE